MVGGLYRHVRNPMYLAVVALIVGQALLLDRLVLLAYAAAVWAVVVAFVHWYEEPTLARKFGAQYEDYRRSVRAWRPQLRPWPRGTGGTPSVLYRADSWPAGLDSPTGLDTNVPGGDQGDDDMTVRLANVTFDCDDVLAVAGFWSAALDRPLDPNPSEYFASIGLNDGDSPNWFFAKVPEPKTTKNRVHVDLTTDDREAEIARLVSLGATRGDDHDEWGHSWTVMADPEGNEFCVS